MAILGDLIHAPQGRLTISSGTAVPTSDITAATSIYYTPYMGNAVPIYNTTANVWTYLEFSEISLSLSGFTADKNNDIFVYNSGGTATLERVEWTNDTTRATALAYQDGRLVKSGDASRLYVGTFRTTGTAGQCEDSLTKRFVSNYYHRRPRRFYLTEATGHTYSTAAWRAWNNTTTGTRVEYVAGIGTEDSLWVGIRGSMYNSSAANNTRIGVTIDETTGFSDQSYTQLVSNSTSLNLHLSGGSNVAIPQGYHYLQIVQYISGGVGAYSSFHLTGQIPG